MAEATQMVILSIGPQSKKIHDLASTEGKTWAGILNWIRTHPGYKRLYWGLQVETPENVQLHIGEILLTIRIAVIRFTLCLCEI